MSYTLHYNHLSLYISVLIGTYRYIHKYKVHMVDFYRLVFTHHNLRNYLQANFGSIQYVGYDTLIFLLRWQLSFRFLVVQFMLNFFGCSQVNGKLLFLTRNWIICELLQFGRFHFARVFLKWGGQSIGQLTCLCSTYE